MEPLRTNLWRTVSIAMVIGAVFAQFWGGWGRWPLTTLLALWPSFGGHWLEVGFLHGLRPRLATAPAIQIAARIATWFVGGIVLAMGMSLTASVLTRFRLADRPAWWLGGLAFIAIELLVHLGLQLRGRPSFYNGRG
jgi:hypothetical protein